LLVWFGTSEELNRVFTRERCVKLRFPLHVTLFVVLLIICGSKMVKMVKIAEKFWGAGLQNRITGQFLGVLDPQNSLVEQFLSLNCSGTPK